MMWSNTSPRKKFLAEKSHSLSFDMRVEDRLHRSIIQASDQCWFTVRPVNYTMELDDTDITNGTASAAGSGISVVGTQVGTGEEKRFRVDVQAAMMNLDPELEFFYDLTYVRDNYSVSVASGPFQVLPNVTNRGAKASYVGDGSVFQLNTSVQARNVLNVTISAPLPKTGPSGTSSYVVAIPLAATVGQTVTVQANTIFPPAGRSIQVGDILFTTASAGRVGTIQSISGTNVTIMTRMQIGA